METNTPTTNANKRPIVIIDGMNVFIRFFMVNQTLNEAGDLVGGTIGFLKAINWIANLLKPSKMFVVWEQGGASQRRKHVFPAYKANRAKQKDFQDLYKQNGRFNPMADQENKNKQLLLLTKALGFLPVCQLYLADTECDDIIAWLVKGKFASYPGQKVVVSSDKDFMQLLEDSSVRIYDIGKKQLVDQQHVLQEYGISPRNMTLARTMVGDQSDNVPGVAGIGFKTISNKFPELASTTEDYDTEWLLNKCDILLQEHKNKKALPKSLLALKESRAILERNWQLMFLSDRILSANQISKLEYRIEEFQPTCNHLEYLKVFTSSDIPVSFDLDKIPSNLMFLTVNS